MSTSARRMTRGDRVPGVWYDPKVELMPALVEARVRDAVTAHLVEGQVDHRSEQQQLGRPPACQRGER